MSTPPPFPLENQLLAALFTEKYQRLLSALEPISLSRATILHESAETVAQVYFPYGSTLVSLVTPMEDGSFVEFGLVGREGVVGVAAFLGGSNTNHRAIVQVAGNAFRLRAELLRAEFDQSEELHSLLLRYTQALLTQAAQAAACYRLHPLEERLARWLLMAQDRMESNELPLTQESISQMLGCRRSGVTVAAGALQEVGLIRYSRGRITILDRHGLENTCCECYGVLRDEFVRLLNFPSNAE